MARYRQAVIITILLVAVGLIFYVFKGWPVTLHVYVMQKIEPDTPPHASHSHHHRDDFKPRWFDQTNEMQKFWQEGKPASSSNRADRKLGDAGGLYQEEDDLWSPGYETAGASPTPQSQQDSSTSRHEEWPKSKGRLCYVGKNFPSQFFPCKPEQLGPRLLPPNASVIETPVLPLSEKYLPEIGNGHVATVVRSDSIFMNGLYNGANTTTHRARIPSTAAVLVKVVIPKKKVSELFRLDLGRGVFSELYFGDGFTVEVRRYAHRELTRLLVTEVVVGRTTFTLPIILSFTVNTGPQSEDINFVQVNPSVWSGRTKVAEYPEISGTTPVTVVYTPVPPVLTFAPSTEGTVAFFTSISPHKADALVQFADGIARLRAGTLFSSHVSAWEALWQRGHIEMTGNDTMALCTNAAMYYLLSSLPLKKDAVWPFVGMSPGGLAHGAAGKDYNGHVFWDQDTWMFPPIVLLHKDVGRLIVDTRIRTLGTAILNAQKTGLKGARYPWESAFTGLPTSPWAASEDLEIHVTGDTSWMMRQYLQLTNDTDFLINDKGYEALASIADFWVSRSVYNQTRKMYEIRDVMGPDEYHGHVNNSVYTNMIAVQSMRTALFAAALVQQPPKRQWEEVASNMFIGFDEKNNYHPEYANYTRGTDVKQADVILLGFPFRWPLTEAVRSNDLFYYATVTPGGPAMTWGIFAVNWLRIGKKAAADEAFYRGTWNIQEPFKVWSEDADGSGAYNFHTGMGGYLQSLLYGYLGVNLNDHSLDLNPQLLPSLTAMAVKGLDYLGGSLDVAYNLDQMNVTLTKAAHLPLMLNLKKSAKIIGLNVGTTVTVGRQNCTIQPRA